MTTAHMLSIPNKRAYSLHQKLLVLGIAHKHSPHGLGMEAFAFQLPSERVKAVSAYLRIILDEEAKLYDLDSWENFK